MTTVPALPPPLPPPAGFWSRYERSRAEGELFEVPVVGVTAVVGALDHVAPVVRWCRRRHWTGDCQVVALTSRSRPPEPDWIVVERAAELIDAIETGADRPPLPVVDAGSGDAPRWLGPLLADLRAGGVGLIRYVLDGDPDDEDLASWHGLVGRPSVLDLRAPVDPGRLLDLVERGEPVASVGGVPLTAELLFALRVETGR